MISMIDLYVLNALQEAWENVKAVGYADGFRPIFNTHLDEHIFADVWAQLELHDITWRSAWTIDLGKDESIVIAVEVMDELIEKQAFNFGYRMMSTATPAANPGQVVEDSWQIQATDTVGIHIYATSKDIVRVMHIFVHAVMMSQAIWFMRTGVDDIMYGGAKDLGPESGRLPNGVNCYLRMQQWAFRGTSYVRRPGGPQVGPPRWITIADKLRYVDAVRDTATRTTIPLEDNLPGGLVPEP